MDKNVYAVWLALALGSKNDIAAALFSRFESAERIWECDDYSFIKGARKGSTDALLDKSLSRAEDICGRCAARGAGILPYEDTLFPAKLRTISNPPAVLYYKGKLRELSHECTIGIVGTRSMTEYGSGVTYAFAKCAAESGAAVISGLASGVDGVAHRGALDAGGYTVAVLGTPIDRVYPSENYELFAEIEEKGVIFSEYYPGCPTNAACFPARNRIIAGLSCALLVTEAGENSGALITARHAVRQGKPVYAVPGQAGNENTAGTNAMLQKGALMAARPADILSRFELLYPDKIKIVKEAYTLGETGFNPPPAALRPAKKEVRPRVTVKKPAVSVRLDYLTETEQKLYDTVCSSGGATADELSLSAGMAVADVLSTVTLLEIYGLIEPAPGGIFKPKNV